LNFHLINKKLLCIAARGSNRAAFSIETEGYLDMIVYENSQIKTKRPLAPYFCPFIPKFDYFCQLCTYNKQICNVHLLNHAQVAHFFGISVFELTAVRSSSYLALCHTSAKLLL